MIVIDAQGLKASRPNRPLFADVSLTVSDGDRIGVVGLNGCGKSTLLRMISGDLEPEAGVVRRGRNARVGILGQTPVLPVGTVREAVGSTWQGEAMLDRLGMSGLIESQTDELSGGQKKLLELGRTMMTDAKIVFLDEVGAGVNRTLLNHIGDSILRLNREQGYTFCMIEHDMEFVARLCDPVICMAEGAVLAEGTIDEVKNNEQVSEAYLGTGLKHKK